MTNTFRSTLETCAGQKLSQISDSLVKLGLNHYEVSPELNHNLFMIYCIHMRVVDYYST